jgi:hypothetical protein
VARKIKPLVPPSPTSTTPRISNQDVCVSRPTSASRAPRSGKRIAPKSASQSLRSFEGRLLSSIQAPRTFGLCDARICPGAWLCVLDLKCAANDENVVAALHLDVQGDLAGAGFVHVDAVD